MAAIRHEAVRQLQAAVGVTADGIFGPNTLKAATKFFNLSPSQAAHFFGQANVETAGFTKFSENLNYSASGLRKTFPKYFTLTEASQYAYKPEKIANRVYANRMGNGNEASGDGWKYRGRGALHLTGKSNYDAFSKYHGDKNILTNPDLVETAYAFLSAKWFFSANKIWDIAKHGVTDNTISQVTRKVNGGYNGLAERKEKTKKYYKILTQK